MLCLISAAALGVSMVLFHTLVELFAVGIALMSFVVAWNTFPLSRNYFLLLVGGGYLWVGILDLGHALSFTGLDLLPVASANATIAFWILARLFESIIFIVAALNFRFQIHPKSLLIAFGIAGTLLSAVIFADAAPALYAEGTGLTPLKVKLEYAIIGILTIAAFMLWRVRKHMEDQSLHLILASIALTIVAELHFTLYTSFSDLPMILGHLFKLISFWLVYQVLIDSSLLRPVRALSRIVDTYDAIADQSVIIDRAGIIRQANRAVREQFGNEVIGQHCHAYLHDTTIQASDCPLCDAISQQRPVSAHEFYRAEDHTWYEASLSGITLSGNYVTMIQNNRIINQRKETEARLHSLNRLYNMRSQANAAFAAAQSKEELLQKITDIAVQYGDFTMAWIGLIADKLVKPEFIGGADAGYLHAVQMRIDDSKWARGPVGLAAKSARVRWVNDIESDPDFEPWREAALERGYHSLAAVPLRQGTRVEGIFTLYSAHKGVFTDAMIDLLSQLSEDLQLALAHFEQVVEKQRAEAEIKKLSLAVEQSANAILIVNTDGKVEYVNQGFSALTGYLPSEVFSVDNPFIELGIWDTKKVAEIWQKVSRGEVWQGEMENRNKRGEQFWTWQTVSPIKDTNGRVTHIVATGADNTELRAARETIEQLAYYDPLTQLANRRLLSEKMQTAVTEAKHHGETLAVMLFDLDDFKYINDSRGHEAGDQLLLHIADVLRSSIKSSDTAARMGGDEFVVLLRHVPHAEFAASVARDILRKLNTKFAVKGYAMNVSSSIGIALYPHDGASPSELLRQADEAMYQAKNSGKNKYRLYQASPEAQTHETRRGGNRERNGGSEPDSQP